MLSIFGPSLILSILCCIHVYRTGREMYWMWIILLFPWAGVIIYAIVALIPDLLGGSAARRVGSVARATLDPERDYRAAKTAYDDSPTAGNGMRLAAAAAGLGRYAEAERLYGAAAQGIHAEDPTLLLGRANALLELNRHAEALAVLEKLGHLLDGGGSPQAALALGRACEGLGRVAEADSAYRWAAERLPGLEAMARRAAFLARNGRRAEAQDIVADLDRRIAKIKGAPRAEARAWRDLAASALG